MQEAPVAQSGPTFLQIVVQMIVTLLVNGPYIVVGAFVLYQAVKRGVIAGRKAEIRTKRKSESSLIRE